jgi:hypothetical protein
METLCDCAFGSNQEVNEVVRMSVREQPETFFPDRIRKIVDCCRKCVELQGGYFEK